MYARNVMRPYRICATDCYQHHLYIYIFIFIDMVCKTIYNSIKLRELRPYHTEV